MDLSIVITTYNRAAVLKQLLTSLEEQNDDDFQIVVAVDGSTDGTRDMLRSLKTNYNLKWIDTHCKGYGLAVARNRGIIAADGEAVVILDDDSFPQQGFIAAHKRSVTRRTITGGPRNPADPADQRMTWKMRELGRLPPCTPISIARLRQNWPNTYLIDNNICLYRQDWVDIGLFSERLKMYGFIGQEFFARAKYLGYGFQYNPDAAVLHHGQFEGDNGLKRRGKQRQIRLAVALGPTLMAPRYYDAQVQWARCLFEGHINDCTLPAFRIQAGLLFPYRFLRSVLADIKHGLKRHSG